MYPASLRIKFARSNGFYEELKREVLNYFETTQKPSRDHPTMYLKTALMLMWLAGAYILLVYTAVGFIQGILCAILLGLAMTGVGFNIQHDANHDALSKILWINRVLGFSLDLLGMSSYVWRWKHNKTHHYYPNIPQVDDDIETNGIGRLAPLQPHKWFHRFQHIYLWILYAFLLIGWQWIEDFRKIIRGELKTRKFPERRVSELVVFILGKLVFVSFALAIPLVFHPWWAVILGCLFVNIVFSASATFILQLAHCAEEVQYTTVDQNTETVAIDWTQHQLNSTVNFAPKNWFLTWFLGGLNFQIEHHLFPSISHVHYPKIAPIVQRMCSRFGLPYHSHRTLRAAVVSHYRFLKRMGCQTPFYV